MPYHHVRVLLRRSISYSYEANLSEDDVKKIGEQYSKGEKLIFLGEWIEPSDIKEILIRRTQWDSKAYGDIFTSGVVAIFEYGKGEDITRQYITSPPTEPSEREKPLELSSNLMKSSLFLGLDANWSLATCALQLQEVAVTLVARRKNILLDKANVEKILNLKIQGDLSFNDRYEAFSKHVKNLFNTDMPILASHLRKMRTKVLHEGYNPKPEETESIVSFTIGLLQRLKDVNQTT